MAPIISNIISDMVTTIDAMTTDSYNLNWGQTNEYDRALIDWTKYDATARIRPADTGEENLDSEDGAHAGAYLNEFGLEVWVDVPLNSISDNTKYDVLERFYLAVDDLKQAFANYDINGYYMAYNGWQPMYDDNNNQFWPYRISVLFSVQYSQDRTDPEQAGDA